MLTAVVPLMVGIGVGEVFYDELAGRPAVLLLPLAVFALAALLLALPRKAATAQGLSFICVLFCGLMLAGASLLAFSRSSTACLWPEKSMTVRAQLVEAPRRTPRTVQAVVSLLDGDFAGKRVRLALTGPAADSLRPGDVVEFKARVREPYNFVENSSFDYATWLRRHGISGTAYCAPDRWQRSDVQAPLSLSVQMLRYRESLSNLYARYLEGRSFAILSALTLGDKSALDAEVRTLFSEGGVSHVLALSGLHLGILFGLYRQLVLRHVRRRKAYVALSLLGLAGVWAFALMAGLPLSLVRAAVMFSVMQLAGCLRRDADPFNNLGLAALLILLCQPQALFDVGFQLSCLSVFFILLLCPVLGGLWAEERAAWKKWLWNALSVSFAAQVGTAPLVAYYFHSFPLYALLANLLIVPMSTLLLGGALAFFLLPLGRPWIAALLDLVLRAMEGVLEILARLPAASLELRPGGLTLVLMYLAVAFLSLYLMRPGVRRLRRFAVAFGFALCALIHDHYAAPSVAMTHFPAPSAPYHNP